MGWVCSSTQMEQDTKELSRMGCFTDGVRCHKPMEMCTWENGKMIRQQVREHSMMLLRVSDTRVSGLMMHSTEKVKRLGMRAQEQSISVSFIKERNKGMEDSSGQMEAIMKVNLWMDSSKATASTILQM